MWVDHSDQINFGKFTPSLKHIKSGLKNPKSKEICETTNEFVERWSRICMFVMKYGLGPCIVSPKVIISFVMYFTTDAGNDAFEIPIPMWWVFCYLSTIWTANIRQINERNNSLKIFCIYYCHLFLFKHITMRFPYDWKNPIGYSVAVSTQYLLAFYPSQFIGCFMNLAFGSFMFAKIFVIILKNELHAINKMAIHKKSRKNMREKISKIIRGHAHSKQLSGWPIYEHSQT